MRLVFEEWYGPDPADWQNNFYRRLLLETPEEVLDWVDERVADGGNAFFFAAAYAMLGEFDRASELLISGNVGLVGYLGNVFPTDPEILRANPTYAAFWRTPPRDKILKIRGHWLPEWGEE